MIQTLLLILILLFTAHLLAAIYFIMRILKLFSRHLLFVERSQTVLEARLTDVADAVRALKDTASH